MRSSPATRRRRHVFSSIVESCEPRRLLAAVNPGQRIDASISSAGEVDTYTINVNASRPYLLVNVATTAANGGFNATVDILDADGDRPTVNATDHGLFFVDDTGGGGTFTVRVRDGTDGASNQETGDYRLTIFTPNGTPADDDSDDPSDTRDDADIDSGRRYAGRTGPGDLDIFQVHAVAGQAVTATVGLNDEGSGLDPRLTIYAPDGSLVHRLVSRGDFRAQQTGIYYAIVSEGGNNTNGLYGVSFGRSPGVQYTGDPDSFPLASGQTRNGDLPAGDTDVFAIPVVPGATLAVTLDVTAETASGFVPQLVLYGPDGRTVTSQNGSSSGVSLPATRLAVGGTYYLNLRDNDIHGGGEFALRYTLSAGNGLTNGITDRTLRVDADDDANRVSLVRADVGGYDALTVTIDGDALSYYAGEIDRVDVYALGGDDVVDASANDINTYVSGGSGDDTLVGGSGNDTLTGGSGRNRLFGGEGSDRLNGSNGRDFLYGEGGNDRLYGQGGNDYLDGGGNVDRVYGGDGDDSLIGGSSNDRLYGESGRDTLAGGRGNDYLDGGPDDDTVIGREPGDTLISIEST